MALMTMSYRPLLAYALVLGAALAVGYFLTSPLELLSFTGLLLVIGLLLLPVLLRWHHALLVFGWNAFIIVFFLPGTPDFWMLAAVVSLTLTLGSIMLVGRPPGYAPARPVVWALVLLGAVVLGTGYLRGGFGMAALGSSTYGGKAYYQILFAIAGYFALAATPIPAHKAGFYAAVFLLSAATALISNLVYLLGEGFYFLYYLFPVDFAVPQAMADYSPSTTILRLGSVTLAGVALTQYLLMRHGISRVFNLAHPLRLLVFLAATFIALFGGFRSNLVLMALTFGVQFYLERLFATRTFLVCLLVGLLSAALLVPLAGKLPLGVQRALSILPLQLDPAVRMDAEASTAWRLQMWENLLPSLPQYLVVGKGFALDPTELAMSEESARRGLADSSQPFMVSGGFHNGPLSVYVPLGSPGMLAFLAFLVCAIRLLYHHYRHGDPALRRINTFLLALFVAKTLMFFFVFGSFKDMAFVFTGLLGLSVSLNRGPARLPVVAPERLVPGPLEMVLASLTPKPRLAPAWRPLEPPGVRALDKTQGDGMK
jgi:hypothetical protein